MALNSPIVRVAAVGDLHCGKDSQGALQPLFARVAEVLKEGMEAGDFRRVNTLHFIPSMIAIIVFHFNTAPVIRVMTGRDPMQPEYLAERRAAVLDFISAALFRAPQGGRK